MNTNTNAILVLEDGRIFEGRALGARGTAFGEVVFNTSMTGYQEVITDPSYCGQIVAFTASHIGNYGVCSHDAQADLPVLGGVVVRESSPVVSNHRAEGSLDELLASHAVVGISQVDTRALTRHLRERGAMRAGIWSPPPEGEDLLALVQASPTLVGRDLTAQVTTKQPYELASTGPTKHRLVVIDFGVKKGILTCLQERGCALDILPASASAAEVMARQPEGVVLSNGPGDPAAVAAGITTARELLGRVPILGICLGHQILGLALGGETFKLRFGHHGGNHPVRDERSGEVWITAQNHCFALRADPPPAEDVELTHVSLYDGTLEGLLNQRLAAMSVQFHPEGCPGPSDARGVFERFLRMVELGGSHA